MKHMILGCAIVDRPFLNTTESNGGVCQTHVGLNVVDAELFAIRRFGEIEGTLAARRHGAQVLQFRKDLRQFDLGLFGTAYDQCRQRGLGVRIAGRPHVNVTRSEDIFAGLPTNDQKLCAGACGEKQMVMNVRTRLPGAVAGNLVYLMTLDLEVVKDIGPYISYAP